MIAGAFGLAAIVKGREPQLPLWALAIAVQLLNIIFLVLNAAGVESYNSVSRTETGYGDVTMNASYSHSLVSAIAISLVVIIVAMVPWGRRNALILGGTVFASWLLAFIVHRGDVALMPGGSNQPGLGLGLWAMPLASVALELALVLVGAFLYYHAAMRTAVRAERADTKEGRPPAAPYRQQSRTTAIIMLVAMLAVLVANFLLGM